MPIEIFLILNLENYYHKLLPQKREWGVLAQKVSHGSANGYTTFSCFVCPIYVLFNSQNSMAKIVKRLQVTHINVIK